MILSGRQSRVREQGDKIMQQRRPVRIVKSHRRVLDVKGVEERRGTERATLERQVKTVVSGWVSDHQQRSEEFRQTYSGLLKELGFASTRVSARR